MSNIHTANKVPALVLDQEYSVQIIKRIRKLRWIGLEEDAKRMQQMLMNLQQPTDSVLAEQYSTD